jgi:lysine 2,3-aminomutase
MKQLFHELVKMRVRPYYVYQCDLVAGAGHFRTSVATGIHIIEALRGHTSGYAIPTYVIDAPGGGGKVPLMPQYVISHAPGRTVLRNFEGFITTYTEPADYEPHDPAQCPACRDQVDEEEQEGVAGLLAGHRMSIAPEGFERLHQRLTRVRWLPIKQALVAEEESR